MVASENLSGVNVRMRVHFKSWALVQLGIDCRTCILRRYGLPNYSL
jgi:hypothetical protein